LIGFFSGRIVPAIGTTTATVSGLVSFGSFRIILYLVFMFRLRLNL
jgi:hypothetical protein